jgi:hypothetical protein
MSEYLDEFRKSDCEKTSLLDNKAKHLRRDREAKNSIIITWHTSFEHIRQSSGIVQSLQSEAPSVTTTALSIASEAQTVVSSAITAIQSDLSSVIPRNCTLGTTFFCLGYVNNVTRSRLPPHLSDLLQLSGLESLEQDLKLVSHGAIEGPLIVGIISTVISVTALQCAFWKESIYAGLFWGLPLETVLGGVGNAACSLSFISPTLVLWVLYSKTEHLPFNITVERGTLWSNCIIILCCAGAMTICVVSTFVRKYIFYRNG